MILGIKTKRTLLLRHLLVGSLSLLLVYLFYLSYGAWGVKPELWPDWGVDHPFWRSWAHAAFVILFLLMIIGPAAKLWPALKKYLPWRRELGIWFAVLGTGHAWAIWDRWANRDLDVLFGVQKMEEMGGYVLARPDVAIMNIMMLMAAPMVILLAVTSSDKAVNFLGISSWKWLHSSLINAIFYIIMLRGILYLFLFFQYSPPNFRSYPSIWFLYPFLAMGVTVVFVQAAAFVKTVLQQRSYNQANSVSAIAIIVLLASLFVAPMTLAAGAVVYFDNRIVKGADANSAAAPAAQNYAKTFYMVIRQQNQEIHIWAKNIDTEPLFRQSIQVAGAPVSEQLYRFDEQSLYSGTAGAGGALVWNKQSNVDAKSIGLANITSGPGVWALQYGPGEREIRAGQDTLKVTIISVGEDIADDIFKTPAVSTPAAMKP